MQASCAIRSCTMATLPRVVQLLRTEGLDVGNGWPRRILFATVTILAVAAVAVGIVAFGGRSAAIDYVRMVGDHELVIGVTGAKADWPRIKVDEQDSTVTVTVNLFDWSMGLPQNAVGVPLAEHVNLHRPLGQRSIVDGSTGSEPPRTRCEPPLYLAPGCVVQPGEAARP